MSSQTFDHLEIGTAGLSARTLAIYEYLVGLIVEQAAIQTGKQPRRNVPPILAALRAMAIGIEQQFDFAGGAVEVALDASGPIGQARWELKIPAGWQSTYQTSAARLLGQRVLRETHAKRTAVTAKREQSREWAMRIERAARQLERPNAPGESISGLQERVHRYLTEGAEYGWFDAGDQMPDPPSRSIVNARLRELGYRRGAYPKAR